MNLNNLTKEQLIETLSKMAEELEMNLANNSVNRLERYVNIDTNEQTFIIKTGQFNLNETQLRNLINDSNNDLEIVEEKTSVSATSSKSIIKIKTESESLAKHLEGCVDAKIKLDIKEIVGTPNEDNEAPMYNEYILSFEFIDKNKTNK